MPHGYSLKSQPPLHLLIAKTTQAKVNQREMKTHPEKEFFQWFDPPSMGKGGNGGGKQRARKPASPEERRAAFLFKLKNRINDFVMDEWSDETPSGIGRTFKTLEKRELEAVWMDLRLEENRAYSEWMQKFHLLNPGISHVFVEREIEHPTFADFEGLLAYISKSRDAPSQIVQATLLKMNAGGRITVNGRKDMEYEITRTGEGWLCVKRDCHLELTGETLVDENLDESRESSELLSNRLKRLDALFSRVQNIIAERRLACDLMDRNSATIIANMHHAMAMVNQAIHARDHPV